MKKLTTLNEYMARLPQGEQDQINAKTQKLKQAYELTVTVCKRLQTTKTANQPQQKPTISVGYRCTQTDNQAQTKSCN
ncbi:hypothetical protein ACFBZI_11685 [Moraxella sp. ZJ142]|uniref:hypothetical protein n=1 Tax=Moraxella marmotae TaxID=3344520 RepID=UPI0035D42193